MWTVTWTLSMAFSRNIFPTCILCGISTWPCTLQQKKKMSKPWSRPQPGSTTGEACTVMANKMTLREEISPRFSDKNCVQAIPFPQNSENSFSFPEGTSHIAYPVEEQSSRHTPNTLSSTEGTGGSTSVT
jgi:hypothetical protein